MRSDALLILLMIGLFQVSFTQRPAPNADRYSDFAVDGGQVWLLTRSGTIFQADLSTGRTIQPVAGPGGRVMAMVKAPAGDLLVGDSVGNIYRLDQARQRWMPAGHCRRQLTGLVVNSQQLLFALTPTGIVDLAHGTVYFPPESLFLNNQVHNKTRWFAHPTYFLDRQDRLWIGFDHGEWGGDLFVFDTQTRQFLRPALANYAINMNPVQSFTEANQTVFMTTGVAHISLIHSTIVRFDSALTVSTLFASENRWKRVYAPSIGLVDRPATRSDSVRILTGGHYIGPMAHNAADSCLYFYSQLGLFKGNLHADLSKETNWQFVLKPTFSWTGGRANAVGSPMNVTKMRVSPTGLLLLLTEQEGLGIVDVVTKQIRFIPPK
jgi:hypothetical protein